jgi:hypothetical protein
VVTLASTEVIARPDTATWAMVDALLTAPAAPAAP